MGMPEDNTFVTYGRSFQAVEPSAFTLHQSGFPVDKMKSRLASAYGWGHSAEPRASCPQGRFLKVLASMPCAPHLHV